MSATSQGAAGDEVEQDRFEAVAVAESGAVTPERVLIGRGRREQQFDRKQRSLLEGKVRAKLVGVLRRVVVAVEEASGLTAHDPQAEAPFLGGGDAEAAANCDCTPFVDRGITPGKGTTSEPKPESLWRGLFDRDTDGPRCASLASDHATTERRSARFGSSVGAGGELGNGALRA